MISALTAADTALAIDFLLRVEVEPALVARDLAAGHAVAQDRSEQVQTAVHAHVRVAALPVEQRFDLVAGGRRGDARFELMQDAPFVTLARVDHAPFTTVAAPQPAGIARLTATERVEDRTVEHDAVSAAPRRPGRCSS